MNQHFATFISILLFGLSRSASAQELGLAIPHKDELVKVTAITQYAEGHLVRTETSGVQTDVVYQTALYEGDRVDTPAGSVAKFTTRSGCIFVLRGEGALAAPLDKKPWRMRAESLRLICHASSGHESLETFGVSKAPLLLKDGEVLFVGQRVILLSGAATLLGQPLLPHKLYAVGASSLSEVSPQPSESDLRQLNLDQNPPREAYVWSAPPAPDKVYGARVIFGPVFSGDRVSYDSTDLSQGGLRTDAPRLQFHFRTHDDHSFIIAATFRDTEDKNDSGGPQPNGVSNKLEQELLEFGYRDSHDRWWSPFWRLGAGFTKAKIGYMQSNPSGFGSSYSAYTYEFYVLTATYGIDAHLTPHFLRPFGLYAGAEGQAVQSIARGGRLNEGSGYNNGSQPNEPWRLTDLSLGVSLGLQYDF